MTLWEVYQNLKACTGRDELALLGTAIFYHERGPQGYEAGYGYTDRGALPQWHGKQIEGVCGELKRFWGLTRPVDYSTLNRFAQEEWKATDTGWAAGVWRAYQTLKSLGGDGLSRFLSSPAGRSEPPQKPFLGVEQGLRGSLSPEVKAKLREGALSADARKYVAIGLGIMGLAWIWARAKGRV